MRIASPVQTLLARGGRFRVHFLSNAMPWRNMKALVFCLSLLTLPDMLSAQLYTVPPDIPATIQNPEFPVHARIITNHYNFSGGSYTGYGQGDILGDKPQGFDYTFSCSVLFLYNEQQGEFYQARWKKQDQKLELWMQKVGTDRQQKCELNVSLKPTPYGRYAVAADIPATAPNPEFSLHARIVFNHYNYAAGTYTGYGRGDLLADKPVGFDYTFNCSVPFLHNEQQGEFYQARWKNQDHTLELLMQKVGTESQERCELNVTLKPAPYGHYGTLAPASPPVGSPSSGPNPAPPVSPKPDGF
jgi:hypothetical protein